VVVAVRKWLAFGGGPINMAFLLDRNHEHPRDFGANAFQNLNGTMMETIETLGKPNGLSGKNIEEHDMSTSTIIPRFTKQKTATKAYNVGPPR